jgi:hypothetical protein
LSRQSSIHSGSFFLALMKRTVSSLQPLGRELLLDLAIASAFRADRHRDRSFDRLDDVGEADLRSPGALSE